MCTGVNQKIKQIGVFSFNEIHLCIFKNAGNASYDDGLSFKLYFDTTSINIGKFTLDDNWHHFVINLSKHNENSIKIDIYIDGKYGYDIDLLNDSI